jgi:hypothetical protein
MPSFRIHRMKDGPRQQYASLKSAPWAQFGAALLKPKDYEEAGAILAPSEYEAWRQLREGSNPIQVGDLLETEQGTLKICKYVGFEPAQWIVPEAKPAPESQSDGGAPPPS